MRVFLVGPRLLRGLIRPGISFSPRDLQQLGRHLARSNGAATSSTTTIEGGFVYVIGDRSGRHKIGSSRDPIARIAQLQTGSAEKLDFSFIAVAPEAAYVAIERGAHDLLEQQKMPEAGNEWFGVPASIAIGAVIEAANRQKLPLQQVQPIQVPQILAIARQQARAASGPGQHCGTFNPLPWFIRWPAVGLVYLAICTLSLIGVGCLWLMWSVL